MVDMYKVCTTKLEEAEDVNIEFLLIMTSRCLPSQLVSTSSYNSIFSGLDCIIQNNRPLAPTMPELIGLLLVP
jgi:hypothetical protein